MPKHKEPELSPAEQFRRFRARAEKLDVDQTGKDLDGAFKKVAPPKRTGSA